MPQVSIVGDDNRQITLVTEILVAKQEPLVHTGKQANTTVSDGFLPKLESCS